MNLTCILYRHFFQIRRLDRSLRVQYLCYLLLEIAPRVLSIFAEVVSFLTPISITTMWLKRLLRELDECVSNISGMHVIPGILSIAQDEGLAVFDHGFSIYGDLNTTFFDWPTANTKDGGSTQDSRWN